MKEIMELVVEIEFLTKENKMLSQRVEQLRKQNEFLESRINAMMADYNLMRDKCTNLFGNH